MWWDHLPYLDELCRQGSMSAAARALRVDKATVSRRLAELCRSAPAPLFERHHGRIQLTAYGARALEAHHDHEQARRRFAAQLESTDEDLHGSVRVTMPGFFACEVVGSALREFLAAHAGLDVQLECSNRVLDVARGETDVALRNVRPSAGSLDIRKLGHLRLATFASRDYLARRGGLTRPYDLSGHDYICCEPGPYSGPGFEWLRAALGQARVTFSASDALVLRAAAIAGLGLVTLPAFMGDETPELERVAGAGEGDTEIWLVTREEQRHVARVRSVRQFLSELVRAQQGRLCPVTVPCADAARSCSGATSREASEQTLGSCDS